jgi:hypothetical protein
VRAALAVCLALLCAPDPGTAQSQRIYDGDEAGALRCANMLALTAMALSAADLISEEEKQVMLGVTVRILDRHVGGTWQQKKRALKIIRDRRSIGETLEDYQRLAPSCLRQYSIN